MGHGHMMTVMECENCIATQQDVNRVADQNPSVLVVSVYTLRVT